MKYLKYVYVLLVVIMAIAVVYKIINFEPEVPESLNVVINTSSNEWYKYSDLENASENVVVAGSAEGPIDISDKLKEHWYSGIITKIEDNTIYFYDDFKKIGRAHV